MHANAGAPYETAPTRPRALARRAALLILVASPDAARADAAAERLRADGAATYVAHSWQGALRFATAVGPDVVLLDPVLPPRLAALLEAHPTSARATILPLAEPAVGTTARPVGPMPLLAAA